MLEAFIFLFAIYGVCCFLYFNLRHKFKPKPIAVFQDFSENQVCLVVKVRDVENSIEALVRAYVKLGLSLELPNRLIVIDTGSQDQTVEIIKRLTYRYPYLTLACENQQFGCRQIVVEYNAAEKPKQVVETLTKNIKKEFAI
jgi:cellulose synthase/poly-beta-1,6-N-acetylglucosamine synthase-like glycosyltransferase